MICDGVITHADSVGRRGRSMGFLTPSVCLFVCPQHNNSKHKWSQSVQTWYRKWSWDMLEVVWFGVEKLKVKVRVRLGLTSIRRGFELCECLLVVRATKRSRIQLLADTLSRNHPEQIVHTHVPLLLYIFGSNLFWAGTMKNGKDGKCKRGKYFSSCKVLGFLLTFLTYVQNGAI